MPLIYNQEIQKFDFSSISPRISEKDFEKYLLENNLASEHRGVCDYHYEFLFRFHFKNLAQIRRFCAKSSKRKDVVEMCIKIAKQLKTDSVKSACHGLSMARRRHCSEYYTGSFAIYK